MGKQEPVEVTRYYSVGDKFEFSLPSFVDLDRVKDISLVMDDKSIYYRFEMDDGEIIMAGYGNFE